MARLKLYIPHHERRAHPEPAPTRDALAILVGLGLWIVGLIVVLLVLPAPFAGGDDRPFWTAVVGAVGGLVLLVVALRRRG